jgi:hypothetical protein
MGFHLLQAKATLWVNRLKTLEGLIFRGNDTEMGGIVKAMHERDAAGTV